MKKPVLAYAPAFLYPNGLTILKYPFVSIALKKRFSFICFVSSGYDAGLYAFWSLCCRI